MNEAVAVVERERGSSREVMKLLTGWFGHKPIAVEIMGMYNYYYSGRISEWHGSYKEAKEAREKYVEEVYELINRCTENNFPITYNQAWALSAMACRHHELCERACERDLTQIEEELQEEIEVVLARFFAESAIRPDHQSDPRGRTLMLYLPNGRYNSWDGESWRIPTPS